MHSQSNEAIFVINLLFLGVFYFVFYFSDNMFNNNNKKMSYYLKVETLYQIYKILECNFVYNYSLSELKLGFIFNY
jgi:hypothetical protein